MLIKRNNNAKQLAQVCTWPNMKMHTSYGIDLDTLDRFGDDNCHSRFTTLKMKTFGSYFVRTLKAQSLLSESSSKKQRTLKISSAARRSSLYADSYRKMY